MSKANEHGAAVKDQSTDRFSSDLEELKSSFSQLREDVTTLLSNASGTARSGAGMLKEQARNMKLRGVESVDEVEHIIIKRPLRSVAMAAGIGFLFALFMRRR
jgi:ElaB/YqjD/DUF883 family membrane-anchored ribosome-binding protein